MGRHRPSRGHRSSMHIPGSSPDPRATIGVGAAVVGSMVLLPGVVQPGVGNTAPQEQIAPDAVAPTLVITVRSQQVIEATKAAESMHTSIMRSAMSFGVADVERVRMNDSGQFVVADSDSSRSNRDRRDSTSVSPTPRESAPLRGTSDRERPSLGTGVRSSGRAPAVRERHGSVHSPSTTPSRAAGNTTTHSPRSPREATPCHGTEAVAAGGGSTSTEPAGGPRVASTSTPAAAPDTADDRLATAIEVDMTSPVVPGETAVPLTP